MRLRATNFQEEAGELVLEEQGGSSEELVKVKDSELARYETLLQLLLEKDVSWW